MLNAQVIAIICRRFFYVENLRELVLKLLLNFTKVVRCEMLKWPLIVTIKNDFSISLLTS